MFRIWAIKKQKKQIFTNFFENIAKTNLPLIGHKLGEIYNILYGEKSLKL